MTSGANGEIAALYRRSPLGTAAFVALLCFVVYNANLRSIAAYDSLASSVLPLRIWGGEGWSLEKILETYPPGTTYSVTTGRKGRTVATTPIVAPILALPFYAPLALFAPERIAGLEIREGVRVLFEKIAASALAAIGVALLFLLLEKRFGARAAFGLALLFAFGTDQWVVSSQGLWQHGSTILLFVATALTLGDRGEKSSRSRLAAAGILAGLLAASRPTAFVWSAAFAFVAWRRHRRTSWPFFAGAAAIAAAQLAYNLWSFGRLWGGYPIRPEGPPSSNLGEFFRWPTLQSIGGLLVSNRGLFVFCPFLLFAIPAFVRALRRGGEDRVWPAAWLASFAIVACFPYWWGGSCYGPRYLVDGLPVLFLLLGTVASRPWGRLRGGAFLAASLWAVALQAIGAFCYPGGNSGVRLEAWSATYSQPALAFHAGPRSPQFLFALAPGLTMSRLLEPAEAGARLELVSPPPGRWTRESVEHLGIRIRNTGTATWSSLGGFLSRGAARVVVRWYRMPPNSDPDRLETDFWMAFRVRPGEVVERDLALTAPGPSGPYRIEVDLAQEALPGWQFWTTPASRLEVPVELVPAATH